MPGSGIPIPIPILGIPGFFIPKYPYPYPYPLFKNTHTHTYTHTSHTQKWVWHCLQLTSQTKGIKARILRLSVSGHVSLTQDKGPQLLTSGASATAIEYNWFCTRNASLEREQWMVVLPARSIFPEIRAFNASRILWVIPIPIPNTRVFGHTKKWIYPYPDPLEILYPNQV